MSTATRCLNSYRTGPDEHGRFGIFGGRFVAETLMPLILEVEAAYNGGQGGIRHSPHEMDYYRKHYIGRPSPLYFAERLTEDLGGAKIYLKREELNHTGSHKINNCLGQVLLAKRMGKTRIIAETGAGQHGVADRDGVRALQPALHGLYGRHRHRAPAAQRLPHEAAGRRGDAGA